MFGLITYFVVLVCFLALTYYLVSSKCLKRIVVAILCVLVACIIAIKTFHSNSSNNSIWGNHFLEFYNVLSSLLRTILG